MSLKDFKKKGFSASVVTVYYMVTFLKLKTKTNRQQYPLNNEASRDLQQKHTFSLYPPFSSSVVLCRVNLPLGEREIHSARRQLFLYLARPTQGAGRDRDDQR